MILLFLYKQKTAYEMRISDWSSDVCSSDLVAGVAATLPDVGILLGVLPTVALTAGLHSGRGAVALLAAAMVLQALEDRKSVVSGKSVSVRVDLGGSSIIIKKKGHNY